MATEYQRMMRLVRRIAGTAAAILPARAWPPLEDHIPVRSSAVLSGLLTFAAGTAIGIPSYLGYAQAAANADIEALMKAAGWPTHAPAAPTPLLGLSDAAWLTFVFLTPAGWVSTYLAITGVFRAIAAGFDDALGDPVLTGVSAAWCRVRDRQKARHDVASRLALEGPEVPDRILTGPQAGFPAADLVVVSSRVKGGWTAGTVVDTGEAFYRIGDPAERTIGGRLRTLYPLARHPGVEVIRRCVQYDLKTHDTERRDANTKNTEGSLKP